MNTLTSRLGAAFAILTLAAAVTVYAGDNTTGGGQGGYRHGDHGGGMGMPGMFFGGLSPRVADELGLSTEQRDTIKAFMDAAKPQWQELHEQAHSTMEKWHATQPDSPDYSKATAEASQAAAEMASRMVTQASQLRAQIYGVLTAEQKAKLPEIEKRMHEQMQERHERHHQMGSPPADNQSPQ